MKFIHILFLLIPVSVFAQWGTPNPRNIVLGSQTTGDGLVYRGGAIGSVNYVPSSKGYAWMHLDTVNNRLYSYINSQWQEMSAASILGFYRSNDTLYLQTTDSLFYAMTTSSVISNSTYFNSNGNDLSGSQVDSIVDIADLHTFYVRLQSTASSDAEITFNTPGSDDVSKTITFVAKNESSTYSISLANLYFQGSLLSPYIVNTGETIIISAQKTQSGNQWHAATISPGTNLSFSGVSSPVTLQSNTGTDVTLTAGSGISLSANSTNITITNTGTLNLDGDKGDVVISSSGTVYTIDTFAVTTIKIADSSVTSAKMAASSVDLSSSVVTNTLPVSKGGTGSTQFPRGRLLVGDSNSTFITNNNLYWDTLNKRLFVGTGWSKAGNTVGSRITSFAADSSELDGVGHLLVYPNMNTAFYGNAAGFFVSKNLNVTDILTRNPSETALILGRPGLQNASWGNLARFDLSKYTTGQEPKTQLDIRLSNDYNEGDSTPKIMTLRADAKVGINDTVPTNTLTVNGDVRIKNLNTSGDPTYLIGAQSDGDLDSVKLGGAISFVNDTLTVKASGIDSNMLTSSSVTWVKLAQAVKDSIGAGGGGGVTSITAGTGLTGGTITTSGTIAADTDFLVTVNDTASMLSPYLRDADTTAMLAPYLREADTLTLSNRINLKVNISDTTAMLLPYLRKVVDSLSFVTTYEGVAVSGEMIWNNQSGTVHLGMTGDIEMPIGQAEAHMVRNTTGSQIAKGKVVYISGASGQRPLISLADADSESTSSGTFGITAEAIDNNDTGFVFVSGYIHGINTSAISPGSALWLDTIAGGFTTSKPVAPIHAVLVGYSITQANNGTIFVKVQNGYELGELHDVNVSGAVNGNLLRYNSSLSIWEDAQADSASIATSAIKTVHIADSAVTSVKLASASVGLNTATTSGTLPVSKGGTGLTTFGGAGRVPYSTGTTGTGLQFDTLFRVFPANSNFFFGQNTGAAITTGLFNNFIGGDAGRETTIGNFNNFLGSSAGEKNTTGSANQFIGNATGANNTTGSSNIFIGNSTGNENRTGSFNYFIGNSAGRNNRNGNMNIFIGRQAGYNTVDTLSGSNNIGIGALAGDNIKFGASKNIAIGDSIDYPIADGNKQLTIGNLIFGVNMDSTGTAIPVNGKIGILNNNPSTALDVSGAITATAFQPLILRRNLSTNTSQLQQLFQLKNASDAYVNYGAIASEIVSNTAGKQIGNMRFSVIDSSDNGTLVNRLILGGNGLSAIGKDLNTSAARTLDVFGEMRIRDLITDTPTRIVGADADGDLGQLIIGTGLSLVGDTLTSTGGSGVADGDKGDIDVTSSGTVWTIDTAAVTKLKLANNSVGANQLDTTAVTAGSYVNPRITVDQDGRLTAAVSDTMAMIIACSDETTNLTTGAAKVTFRAPFAFTILGVRANVKTAPTGNTIVVIIKEGGNSIFSTNLSIDASEKTSVTAAVPVVISDTSIADDAEMTIDIDQIGSTAAGVGLKLTILYRKN
jgi:hypothetical protein